MSDGRSAGRARKRLEYLNPDRMTQDRPLPGLDLPDAPGDLDSTYEVRHQYMLERRNTIEARNRFREQIRTYTRENPGPLGRAEIRVRFVLGDGGVRAVVEWRDARVGGAGLLRRLDGPLRLDSGHLRRLGPGVALLGALRALTEAMTE